MKPSAKKTIHKHSKVLNWYTTIKLQHIKGGDESTMMKLLFAKTLMEKQSTYIAASLSANDSMSVGQGQSGTIQND